MTTRIKQIIKAWMTSHAQGDYPNFFIFSTPRSGSTWLAELLASQGRFKIVNEPFNLRKEMVRENLGLKTWESLMDPDNRQVMSQYLNSFLATRHPDYRFPRERPFSRFWHAETNQIIFKILFAGEDSIPWFRSEFNAHVIFLIRHPIPVSLSRKALPRLESLITEPFSRHFTEEQLEYARAVVEQGDRFQMAILDWCLQNALPLRQITDSGLMIFYEEFVMYPEIVISELVRNFDLSDSNRILDLINKPSRSTALSRKAYRDILLNEDELQRNRAWLIERWKTDVNESQEKAAFQTLEIFGIDCYEPGNFMPADKYLTVKSAARSICDATRGDRTAP